MGKMFSVQASGVALGVSAMIKKLLSERSGATAIEYALIATAISIAIAAIVFSIGSKLSTTMYNSFVNLF